MAKLDIDIVLLDDSVVMYGFRALMTGARLEEFRKNPVLLLQHNRPSSYAETTDIMLPIGRWNDIRVEDNRLLAKPEFDDDDELAVKVQNKVKKGYLNAASVWIDPITFSEDEKDMLPGQSLPTFTEWNILEASIVDIPNCKNALAIRNTAGKRIELSAGNDEEIKDFITKISKNNSMDKKFLCALLGLAESAPEDEITKKINEYKLSAESGTKLQNEVKTLKDQIVNLKTAADAAKNKALVDQAIAEKKILPGQKEQYIKLAAADYDTTKSLLDGMKPIESIQTLLANKSNENAAEAAELMKLSGRDLYMSGRLEKLQAIGTPEQFKIKYKEAFGVEYQEAN